ncbi:SAGA-associated factor 11 homolog [Selaginella moellendorffii]|uniref:SAGA-associated factor 11 homolog n=1 Tax=Selaginella moellendorffii TaxID=88036 RepID=UPI000D1C28C3|nr:SAGA-associated factor 11 homolog [Selaginella moellendorffii]|eukprot:XP_002963785.2 SAGA-associated factor 11 homolog [Selaginella moellendorffii]
MDSDSSSSRFPAQEAAIFAEILDSLIVDVAAEAHRAARLGFDPRIEMGEEEELRLSSQARSLAESGSAGSERGGGEKYVVDMFGQSHPAIASQQLQCMNCGRSVAAGRFAPHLEKCLGKGRRTRAAANKNVSNAGQQRRPGSGNSKSSKSSGSANHVKDSNEEDPSLILKV